MAITHVRVYTNARYSLSTCARSPAASFIRVKGPIAHSDAPGISLNPDPGHVTSSRTSKGLFSQCNRMFGRTATGILVYKTIRVFSVFDLALLCKSRSRRAPLLVGISNALFALRLFLRRMRYGAVSVSRIGFVDRYMYFVTLKS